MGSNLPPGTTPADIDRHFGEPERHRKTGEIIYDISSNEPVDPIDVVDVSGGEIVHTETIEETVYTIHIAVTIDTQYDTTRDIAGDMADNVSVSSTDENVEVQYIDVIL
jgi:hypothetical protein